MTNIQTKIFGGRPALAGKAPTGDDELLARQANEDSAAFAELYRRHLSRVYRYLLVRLGTVQDAQDVTSQTFLAALEGIASYRGKGSFAAWLLGIARRKAAYHFRQRREMLPLEGAASELYPDPSPEELVAERLRLEQVAQALRTLAPERGEALALQLFGGLSATEVAQVMGKNEAAVKMLTHRAVHDLQERLAPTTETQR
jgi:RNA polymerase sigma-70 factor (ECF subfamily)